jgi:hypothetical protein
MWKKAIGLLLFLFFVVFGVATYKYIYQKHRDIQAAESDFERTSEEIYIEFAQNSNQATKKYVNKIITVTGVVSERDVNSLTLNTRVVCYFSKKLENVNHPTMTIKGRCIGFDELLEVVKLDECSVVKK